MFMFCYFNLRNGYFTVLHTSYFYDSMFDSIEYIIGYYLWHVVFISQCFCVPLKCPKEIEEGPFCVSICFYVLVYLLHAMSNVTSKWNETFFKFQLNSTTNILQLYFLFGIQRTGSGLYQSLLYIICNIRI